MYAYIGTTISRIVKGRWLYEWGALFDTKIGRRAV